MIARARIGDTARAAALAVALILFAIPAHAQWVTQQVQAERVQLRTFQSAAADTLVSYHVYTPPQYDAEPERSFPVLYWLHGSGSATAHIAPISAWFHDAIAAGDIAPMIVVMPNGMAYRMWCDSFDGNFPMESVVIDDLLPEVDAAFRTISAREGRIVEGFSMGGQGAARLGLRRPDLFAGVSILGAGPLQEDFLEPPEGDATPEALRLQIYEAVWGSDPAYYLQQHPRTIAAANAPAVIASAVKIRQAIGALDTLAPMNAAFHDLLLALDIPHTYDVLPGVGHSTLPLLTAMGESNWQFYRDVFGDPAHHPADLNADGRVDGADLGLMLGAWGACPSPPAACASDLNASGAVDGADLGLLLGAWG